MDKKELKQLTKLYDKFFDDCCRVRDILIDSNKRHGEYVDITYADTFNIMGDYVSWKGDEYWEHGGYEEHSGYFPLDLLTMTDDELREIVAKENEELEREEEMKKKEKADREKAERLAKYEELKKEFGDE